MTWWRGSWVPAEQELEVKTLLEADPCFRTAVVLEDRFAALPCDVFDPREACFFEPIPGEDPRSCRPFLRGADIHAEMLLPALEQGALLAEEECLLLHAGDRDASAHERLDAAAGALAFGGEERILKAARQGGCDDPVFVVLRRSHGAVFFVAGEGGHDGVMPELLLAARLP